MSSQTVCGVPQRPALRAAMTTPESLAAVTACLLWSTAFPVVKIGLQWMDPFTFAGIRFMLAGMLLVFFCARGELKNIFTSHLKIMALTALLQTVILYGVFFVSLKYVGGAKAAIIVGSSPWLSMLMAHWMMHDDRLSIGKLWVLAIGIIGLVMLAVGRNPAGGLAVASTAELIGMCALMTANICSCLAGIFIARDHGIYNPVALNSAQMFSGGSVLLIAGLCMNGIPAAPPLMFYPILLWVAVLSAIGFSVWFVLLKRIKVSYLNMYKCLIPICGAVLSWFLLADESPTPRVVTGMVLTAVAVLLSQILAARESRRAR